MRYHVAEELIQESAMSSVLTSPWVLPVAEPAISDPAATIGSLWLVHVQSVRYMYSYAAMPCSAGRKCASKYRSLLDSTCAWYQVPTVGKLLCAVKSRSEVLSKLEACTLIF